MVTADGSFHYLQGTLDLSSNGAQDELASGVVCRVKFANCAVVSGDCDLRFARPWKIKSGRLLIDNLSSISHASEQNPGRPTMPILPYGSSS